MAYKLSDDHGRCVTRGGDGAEAIAQSFQNLAAMQMLLDGDRCAGIVFFASG